MNLLLILFLFLKFNWPLDGSPGCSCKPATENKNYNNYYRAKIDHNGLFIYFNPKTARILKISVGNIP